MCTILKDCVQNQAAFECTEGRYVHAAASIELTMLY